MNRIVNTRFVSLIHGASLRILVLLSALLVSAGAALAQTTAFTYQGRLADGGNPANGPYDLQVRLFDAATGGNQIGTTNSINGITVTGGVFTATLDFGAAAFPGANRWAEISARPAGNGSFTTLNPRQPVTSTPYAIQSLNAATANGLSVSCNGCVTGAQIGSLPATSGNYIQNTSAQQANGNFNISGSGTVGVKLGVGNPVNNSLYKLDVTNANGSFFRAFDFNASGGTRLMADFNGGSGNGGQARFSGVGNGFMDIGQNAAGDFVVEGSDVPRLTVQNAGNVGIGTNTPGSLLTLNSGSATAPALEVNQGGIKVAGAGINSGTAVFIHEVTAGNIDPELARTTVIDNPLTNGDVNAILIVTPVLRPGRGVVKQVFLDYNTAVGRWRMTHFDGTPMAVGENFNVMVVKP